MPYRFLPLLFCQPVVTKAYCQLKSTFLVNYRWRYADSFTRSQNREARNFDGEYVTIERYFIQIGNAAFVEIRLTKESLLKALPEKAPQLKERFRSKNLT